MIDSGKADSTLGEVDGGFLAELMAANSKWGEGASYDIRTEGEDGQGDLEVPVVDPESKELVYV